MIEGGGWTLAVISYPPLVRIHLGPLAVCPHGIGAALGLLAGSMLMQRAARQRGIDETLVSRLLTRAIVGGLVGPAVLCAHHPSAFASPLEVLRVWEGGLTLLGGIAGSVAAGLPLVIQSRLPVLRVLDTAAPGLALGIAVGRLGDLAIADHLGRPTNFPLGFRCPPVAAVGQTVGSPCPPGTVVHLTAAYDLLAALLVFGLLTWLRRRPGRDGRLALAFALAYGLVRVAEGFTRNDKQVLLGLDGSQLVAGLMVLAAAGSLLYRRRSARSDVPAT